MKHSNFKKNVLKLSIFQSKIVLRNVGNFEVHVLIKKMSADDIFLAVASPIADRRKIVENCLTIRTKYR
jgi:hypothetical protein